MKRLPPDYKQYTDAYFLRSLEILQKEQLNPFVRAQIFIRKGPGKVYGILEACGLLDKFSTLKKNGGIVYALQEGDIYSSDETIMILEGKVQDIIPFETILLGVISAETTKENDKTEIDLAVVTNKMQEIASLVGDRMVIYFGARHWRYDEDAMIASAAFAGGATGASTDIGARAHGQKGVGTIPHALECLYAWKFGMENAVVQATKAFDRVIDPKVSRVALIDFANREIDDSLSCANVLGKKLYGVRVDTCGENIIQGAYQIKGHSNDPFWYGSGVTISGVYTLRMQLNKHGFDYIKIVLSSGFGNSEKVKAFVAAEKELGVQLFDSLGVGELFPVRAATMDIVGVGETSETIWPLAKIGRKYLPNVRLR